MLKFFQALPGATPSPQKPKVLVSKGRDITKKTLMALEKLAPKLPKQGSRILIKPNLLEPRSSNSGAVTRPEVIEAVIQFLDDNKYEIYVGEGAAILDTSRCFEKAIFIWKMNTTSSLSILIKANLLK